MLTLFFHKKLISIQINHVPTSQQSLKHPPPPSRKRKPALQSTKMTPKIVSTKVAINVFGQGKLRILRTNLLYWRIQQ